MARLHGWKHRLRVWLRPNAYAAELAEEEHIHMEMESSGDRSMPVGEARASGTGDPRFHGPAPESSIFERVVQDLRYATRGLVRSPGFTAFVVVTLALGVGANAAVFSLLQRLFDEAPVGVREPETLRRLYTQHPNHPLIPGMVFPMFTYPVFAAIQADEIGSPIAWTRPAEETLVDANRRQPVRVSYVSPEYFSTLGVGAARGRTLTGPARVDIPDPVAVISYALWRSAFALDPSVLGRTIELRAGDVTLVGVLDDGFAGLDMDRVDVFLPLSMLPQGFGGGDPWYQVLDNRLLTALRVDAASSDEVLSSRATAAYQRHVTPRRAAVGDTANVVLLGSMSEVAGIGRDAWGTDRGAAVSISARAIGVSTLLLLIACANVACLLLVRVLQRRREIAVRLALGVSRARLGLQLLLEGIVLATLAGSAAVLVASVGGRVLRSLLLPEIRWAERAVEPQTLWFALGTATLAGLITGLAPLLQARTVDARSLKTGAPIGARTRSGLRSTLLAAQAGLSIVLLVGAGLFLRSLDSAMAVRVGFDVNELAFVRRLQLQGGGNQQAAVEEVAARLASIPGVTATGLGFSAPMMGYGGRRVFAPTAAFHDSVRAAYYATVSPGYFGAAGTRVLEGRDFQPGDGRDVVIVDEAMAREYWPGRSALGECLHITQVDAPCRAVVGVIEDQRWMRVMEEPVPQYFIPVGADSVMAAATVLMRIDPRRWDEIAARAREAVDGRFDPDVVRIGSMAEFLEPQYRPWRVGAQLFTAFAILALLITVVGVYGVMAYAVSQRTHEVGVRMALGARVEDVLRLVMGESALLLLVGSVLGLGAALLLGRVIASFLYGVTPTDGVSLAGAAAIMLGAGVAATLIPAWRASRVDPCEALRQD